MNKVLLNKSILKKLLCVCAFFINNAVFSQEDKTLVIETQSVFKNLKIKDSVVFYQCHVETGTQQLSTASGQTITGNPKKYSITEKYIITKLEKGYKVNYFISSLNIFPNKKFAGLKFKERSYWDFKEAKTFNLEDSGIQAFLAMEEKGRDAVVYDYGLSKYNTNLLIIRYPNDYKQLVIDGPYVISILLNINDQ